MPLVVNTAALAAAVLCLAVPSGVVLALLAWRTDLPGRAMLKALLASSMLAPLYVQAAAWQAGFGIQGWQAVVLGTSPWLVGFWGAVWVHTLAAIPWVAALTSMGLMQVEPSLEELALLETPPWRVVWQVTLRRAAGHIVAAAAWTAASVAGEMTVTDLFGVRTFAERLYVELAIGGEPGEAPRLALPGVITTMALLALVAWSLRGIALRPRGSGPQRKVTFRLAGYRWPIACLAALCIVAMTAVPLANLAYQAGIVVETWGEQRVRSWSAWRLAAVVADSPFRFSSELAWTGQLGVLSATAAVALALVLAWWSRATAWRGAAATCLAALSLAAPGPVVGLGLIRLLDRPDWPGLVFLYDQSLAAPLLALVFKTFGIALLVLRAALLAIPMVVWDAAALDGLVGWRRLVHVTLPLVTRPLTAVWLVTLAMAVGELSATILVLPPRVTTLAVRVSTLTHYGVEDRLAGLCLTVWLLSAGLALFVARFWRGPDDHR